MPFKKGQSGNPKGRTPIILPEVQREIDQNKNAFKKLVLLYFNLTESQITERQRNAEIPFIEKWLAQVMERGANDGDVIKFKMLLEMVFGKMPEDKAQFEMTEEERQLILTYRERLMEDHARRALPDSGSSSKRSPAPKKELKPSSGS